MVYVPPHLDYLKANFRIGPNETHSDYIERLERHCERHRNYMRERALAEEQAITDRIYEHVELTSHSTG